MTRTFLNRNRQLDSWTYGDWRQYVCTMPDGGRIIAKIAMLAARTGDA